MSTTTTQTPESCEATCSQPTEHYHPSAARYPASDRPVPCFNDAVPSLNRNRLFELFRLAGIDLSREEFQELSIFDEFLMSHIQEDGIFSVQCMLVWNEWVRTFRHKTHEFPHLILEKEFRSALTEKFDVAIEQEGHRGTVYAGIRYVP